jgi:DNA-binding response OmpR family regulator
MPKILLAEDDPTMVSLLKTLLTMEGFEVVALDVKADIPAAIARETPENLMIDVHLGDQNGLDVVEKIRSIPDNKALNIVMASGLDVRDECLRRGANHFLLKPFMPDDLLNLMKK